MYSEQMMFSMIEEVTPMLVLSWKRGAMVLFLHPMAMMTIDSKVLQVFWATNQ